LERDPSREFSTSYYLRANADVRESELNPLVHFIRYGMREGRAALPPKLTATDFKTDVDVVVPVYNALPDVKECLRSVLRTAGGHRCHLIVVNDGSDEDTTKWLRKFCDSHGIHLIEHAENHGYTRSVNDGMRASTSEYVVTLNSDTIVTPGWLNGLLRAMHSCPDIGMVGPLSNAASWQNVPDLLGEDGTFAINKLPKKFTPDDMSRLVATVSTRRYPVTPFLNGFCYMTKREVIRAIGYLDEENFPMGYGEENDYCIRASEAGFKLTIADDTYVFHSKSKSFGHSRRKELSQHGSNSLKRKHSHEKVQKLIDVVRHMDVLDEIRVGIRNGLKACEHATKDLTMDVQRILFLLPVKGGSGGAHSVIQEVVGLRSIGVDAVVAVKADRLDTFLHQYEDIRDARDVFLGFDEATLLSVASNFDVVVGTIFSSMWQVEKISKAFPHILPAYYVQDYEPLFFTVGSEHWKTARASYSLVPTATLFAKTHWIIRQVAEAHGVNVRKVEPSIDHSVYHPRTWKRRALVSIAAMIRPQTPRRGAERTMRVLSGLAKLNPGKLAFQLFGCDAESTEFLSLQRDFEFRQHGVLRRPEVASLLAECDIFIDLSDYQAFGRTALEAMACGCAAMVPAQGGGDEYAIDGANSLVVDSFDEAMAVQALHELVNDPCRLHKMRMAGLMTAAKYSVHRAAVSELTLLSQSLTEHRAVHPKPERDLLRLMPTATQEGRITGSGYVRVLLPYQSSGVLRAWSVNADTGGLPAPGTAGAVLIQRDARGLAFEELRNWSVAWKGEGGKIIYEIDDDLFDLEALRQRGYAGDLDELEEKTRWLARNADLVTTATESLAGVLRGFSNNVRVIPNYLDGSLWKLDSKRDHASGPFARHPRKLRIGYIGTPSHDKDLDLVCGAMQQLERKYGDDVEIEIIGGFQVRKPTFGKRVWLPKNRDYPSFVRWLLERVHWDIGIIPLLDDEFNRSKSHIKFLEYAALGLAIVCSDVPSYNEISRHEENSLLVENTEQAWYQAVKRLVEDAGLRLTLAASAREDIKKKYTIEANKQMYLDALQSIGNIGADDKNYFLNHKTEK